MKLEFSAILDEVKGKKDHGFKWVLFSGEDSLQEAAEALALVQAQQTVKITVEVQE